MSESDNSPDTKRGPLVRSIFDLVPGKRYRLHLHESGDGGIQIEEQEFYIEKPIDPQDPKLINGQLIHVWKVGPNGGKDSYSPLPIRDLGMSDVRGEDRAPDESGDLSWTNWVEEIPNPKPPRKDPK